MAQLQAHLASKKHRDAAHSAGGTGSWGALPTATAPASYSYGSTGVPSLVAGMRPAAPNYANMNQVNQPVRFFFCNLRLSYYKFYQVISIMAIFIDDLCTRTVFDHLCAPIAKYTYGSPKSILIIVNLEYSHS